MDTFLSPPEQPTIEINQALENGSNGTGMLVGSFSQGLYFLDFGNML